MKTEWKTTLDNLVAYINSVNTGETLIADYFLDNTDGLEKVDFIITPIDYYGYTGNETFEYYFKPIYNVNDQGCSLEVCVTAWVPTYTW